MLIKTPRIVQVSLFCRENEMEMKCIETTYILINRLSAIVKRPTVNSYYRRHCKQKTQTHRTDHTIFIMKKMILHSGQF